MVKNDKKNKREYERKARAEGGREQPVERTQKSGQPASSKALDSRSSVTSTPPSNFTGIHAVLQSRWSRNYLRPGAGAENVFSINIYCSQFGVRQNDDKLISSSIGMGLYCYRS